MQPLGSFKSLFGLSRIHKLLRPDMSALSQTQLSLVSGSNLNLNNPPTNLNDSLSNLYLLPSLYLGQDVLFYDLLFEIADFELRNLSIKFDKVKYQPIQSSFSILHPIRLLLACLPTYANNNLSNNKNRKIIKRPSVANHGYLENSLICSPTSLLNSTPFKTLYQLQVRNF